MDVIDTIVQSELFEAFLKLLLSALLAGFIGLERSSLNKPAGFGTYSIIGLSSALVVMASEFMAIHYNIDASRIPSQIIAGIGFIGAGTILRNGFNVRGVTTAAGILSVTCIGISVGMGYYLVSIIATLIVYFILSVNHGVSGKFEKFELLDLVITVKHDSIEEIENFIKDEKIIIQSVKKENRTIKNKKVIDYKIMGLVDSKKNHKVNIVSKLVTREDVIEVIDESNIMQ